MFARKYRLPANVLFSRSLVVYNPLFTLKIKENGLQLNRYGFVVGKKIDKRSTVRNRLKRQFRSCLEEFHNDLKQGKDLLFILKKESLGKSRSELFDIIKTALVKCALFAK